MKFGPISRHRTVRASRTGRKGETLNQRLLAALLALYCLYPTPAAGQATKFLPHDEASRQPDFFSFRARLLVSLTGRDTAGLLNVVAPPIRNTFGDDNGVAAFRRLWRLEAPDSEIWGELTAVLALGGHVRERIDIRRTVRLQSLALPLRRFRVPGGHRLRRSGSLGASAPTAPVVTRVGFEVVERTRTAPKALTPAQAALWEPIQLNSGRIGYMAKQFLRSPIGYRAVFIRRDTRSGDGQLHCGRLRRWIWFPGAAADAQVVGPTLPVLVSSPRRLAAPGGLRCDAVAPSSIASGRRARPLCPGSGAAGSPRRLDVGLR